MEIKLTYEQTIDRIIEKKSFKNQKNFRHFMFEKIKGDKLHLNRYFLIECKGELKIKYYDYLPTKTPLAYATLRVGKNGN